MKKIISLIALICTLSSNVCAEEKTKITIFGDSYSTYEGYLTPDTNEIWYFKPENPKLNRRNDVRTVEQTWWHQVISNLDAQLEVNNAFSGSTICHTGYSKGPEPSVPLEGFKEHRDYTNRSFENRSNKLGNPDIILICGGTNDSWCGAPIGEYVYGNQTTEQLYYFRPAMAKLLADLRTNYPNAKLLFILNSELKEEINESVHTICAHYSVPCLDLKDVDKQQGHPSVKGMKSIADQVTAWIKNNLKL
jgi:hypothetical protein